MERPRWEISAEAEGRPKHSMAGVKECLGWSGFRRETPDGIDKKEAFERRRGDTL